MVPVFAASAASNEFSITGISGYTYRVNNNDWYIILNTDNADFSLSATPSLTTAGVTIDGAAAAGYFQPGTGTLAFTLKTDKANHKVVLPAGMVLNGFTLKEDYVFFTQANGGVKPGIKLGIDTTKGNGGVAYQDNQKRYILYLTGLENYDNWNTADTLYVNDVEHSATGNSGKYWYNNTYFGSQVLVLYYDFMTSGATTAPAVGLTTFEIPAGTVIGSSITTNTLRFSLEGYTLTIQPPEVNITSVTGAYNNQYLLKLYTDEAYTLTANQQVTLLVNGEEKTVWLNVGTPHFIAGAKYIPLGDNEITIPAGTRLGDSVLAKDYTFYTHADGSADTTPNVKYVNITGIKSYLLRDNDWYIVLNVDNAAFTMTNVVSLATTGITVDGAATTGWIQMTTGTLAFDVDTDKADHEIIIPAGTVLGDYVLENDYVFYTHADGAVNTEKPVQRVNITEISGGYNSQYIVRLTTDVAYTLSANQALTVNVDGSDVSVWLNVAEVPFISMGSGVAMGEHVVVIPAGTKLGDSYLAEDFTFYTHADGSVNTVPNIKITGISGGYNNQYIVNLITNNAYTLTGNQALTVKVDGADVSVWLNVAEVPFISMGSGVAMGEHVVVIPAGTKLGDSYLAEDFTFYTHADGAVNTEKPVQRVNITEISGGYNSQYIVRLTTDKAYTLTANQALTVNVDGSDVSVWLNVAEVPFISGGEAIPMGEHIVVIPADTKLGDSVLGEEFIFYTHADGSVDLEDPTVDEPVYPMVNLTVKDENGQTVMSRSVAWHTDSIALVEQELKATVSSGKILLGYASNDALYASIGNISVAEGNVLDITLKTLDLAVHTEIRHGENMADSGLRFVAALGQTEYIPKVLLISEALETLTVAEAQWKIGNPYHTEEKPFMEVTAMDGTVSYNIALTNIPTADYNKTYYACAGVLVEYADIGQNYVYTDAVATTVNEAAENNWLNTDVKDAYVNGVMVLDADANLIGSRSYTISVSNDANGDYVIAYTGSSVKVSALTIEGLRFTAEDGVVFGDGIVTVPGGLFAAAKLEQELVDAQDKMDIGAYYGPSVGTFRYTQSNGSVSDMSVKRTHDAVYADVEDYFGAGFNIWMAEDWVYGGTHYSENDAFSALDLAAEYCINHGLTNEDIKVLITDGFINGLLDGTDMNNGDRNAVSQYASIAESHINALISYNPVVNGVQVGAEYNCFAGFLLRDEPYYNHMTYYAPWFSFLAADADQTVTVSAWNTSGEQISGEVSCLGMLEKGYTLYFSLLGMGASKQSVVPGSTSADPCSEAEYLAYVNAFVDNINATVWNHENMVLAFDNYGLYTQASTSFASSTINYTEKMSANWQQNYALFADIIESKGGNATFATALRSDGMVRKSLGGFWSTKTWKEFQAFDASWGAQAISMQAYTALAHGYSYINYYTYWEPVNQAHKGETYTDACVMWDDNMNPVKQNMYYWVQSANAEVRQLENLIANFSYVDTAAIAAGGSFYTGTGNVGGTDMGGLWTASQLAEASALASISASADTTAGYFSKEIGQFNDMFILVNMSHPNQAASDTVSMTFDAGYSCVIVYLDGVASVYQLHNGQCSVTLPSGEGAVVIPVA